MNGSSAAAGYSFAAGRPPSGSADDPGLFEHPRGGGRAGCSGCRSLPDQVSGDRSPATKSVGQRQPRRLPERRRRPPVRSRLTLTQFASMILNQVLLSMTGSSRPAPLPRRLAAEALGTALLVAVVVGSGIAAAQLSPNDVGFSLLENSTGYRLRAGCADFGSRSGVGRALQPARFASRLVPGPSIGPGLSGRDVGAYAVAQVLEAEQPARCWPTSCSIFPPSSSRPRTASPSVTASGSWWPPPV